MRNGSISQDIDAFALFGQTFSARRDEPEVAAERTSSIIVHHKSERSGGIRTDLFGLAQAIYMRGTGNNTDKEA